MVEKRRDEEYEVFLRAIRPISIALRQCDAVVNREQYLKLLEGRGGFGNVSSKYALGSLLDRTFTVTARMAFEVPAREGSRRDPRLRIDVVFDATFQSQQRISRRFARKYADAEARIVFWPYFREFISSMTARMSISPLLMPFSIDTEAQTSGESG